MDDHTRGPYWARCGMNQMVEPNATTVACMGTPDGQGPFWFIFSDAEQHGDQEQTAKLLANSWRMHSALERIAAMDKEGIRADDLGRAARIASEALAAPGAGKDGGE